MTFIVLNANSYGPLSTQRLEYFESKAQIRLPADYRDFLLQYNGGQPSPSFFWIKPRDDGSEVLQFYGLHDGPRHLSIETYTGDEQLGIPVSMLPIGDDGVGNHICIGISSSTFGYIYFIDHDLYNESDESAGVTMIADSFSGFLSALRNPP